MPRALFMVFLLDSSGTLSIIRGSTSPLERGAKVQGSNFFAPAPQAFMPSTQWQPAQVPTYVAQPSAMLRAASRLRHIDEKASDGMKCHIFVTSVT